MKAAHCLVLLAVVGFVGCGAKSGPAGGAEKTAGNVDAAADNMNTLAVSMVLMDKYPRAAICDKAGKPLLSWRVAILPKLGQDALYKEFKLDEPWDGPNNKKLLERMPDVYASPGVTSKELGMTHFQVFIGPKTIWEDQASETDYSASILPRGTLETMLLAEASDPVPWTKPQDIHYDPQKPVPALGKVLPDRFLVVMAEGSVFLVNKSVPEQALRNAITSCPPKGLKYSERLNYDVGKISEEWKANAQKWEKKK